MTKATGDSRRRAAAAVDIGGTKVAAAVVTSDGSIIAASHRPSRGVAAQEATALLAEDLRAAIATAQADGFTVESLGIGATGRHVFATGTLGAIDAVLDGWGGSSLPRDLALALGIPLSALLNDADAAALAENRLGAGVGADPCAVVTLGTGIGVALIHGGTVLTGSRGAHGEYGHISIALDGALCFCGARGCWESFAGGGAIERAWLHENSTREAKPASEIFNAAAAGDAAAASIINAAVRATALGIANIAVTFAPATIVIGGGIAAQWERFANDVQAELGRRAPILSQLPEIRLARFGAEAVLVGAGIAALDAGGVMVNR
jgi:glucokinase